MAPRSTSTRGQPAREWKALKRELKTQGWVLGGALGSFFIIEIIDLAVFGGGLDVWGVRPRELIGLLGVIFAPFLHGGMAHLLANAIPFAVLGWLVLARDIRTFLGVTLLTQVVSGLGTWAVGASGSVHVGASGLIFGYFAFLLLAGWFERRVGPIIVSVLVLLGYGGFLFGLLPGTPGVSWPMHFFGFVGGILGARVFARRQTPPSPEG